MPGVMLVGQPNCGPLLIWKWKPPNVGFAQVHPRVCAVLLVMVCVALQVWVLLGSGFSTSGVGVMVSAGSGALVAVGCGACVAGMVACAVACALGVSPAITVALASGNWVAVTTAPGRMIVRAPPLAKANAAVNASVTTKSAVTAVATIVRGRRSAARTRAKTCRCAIGISGSVGAWSLA